MTTQVQGAQPETSAADPAAHPAIQVKHLTKIYPTRGGDAHAHGWPWSKKSGEKKAKAAADNVNFSVAPGEFFVIMGLSGSGKSTVLRMLNRLVEPTSGELLIDGRDVATMPEADLRELRNRKINMVFQHFALFPHRTVRENAAYALHVRHESEAKRNERADWALETVGLGDWGDHLPGELSGGMRQRVGLARALASDADILLMDEPFSALDPLIHRDMQDLFMTLQRDLHRTVVFVTHDPPVGIWAARSRRASGIVRPILDFMQTLPVFVYLIPAVFFFGIGPVPGVVATTVFAIPPAVRLTELGIRNVDRETVEAAVAFGAKPRQMLREVQLPLAMPSIMAGINQTIMLALSCVVIAGLVGAGGLGAVVVRGISTLDVDVGAGFEGGLAVVFLAIFLDRLTNALAARRGRPRKAKTTPKPTPESTTDEAADQAVLASS